MIPVATIQGPACCAPLAESPLGADDAETLARALKALADPARLRILSLVAASPEGEICVCELPAPLGLTQPTVSHHLKVLAEAGFLEREKRGTWAYFRLVPGALDAVTRPLAEPVPALA